MSQHAAFRRQAVPQQYAQALQTLAIPAPTRGLIQSENEAYMQPGGALIQDNWVSTLRGVKLRGGCIRWCDLHALDVAGAAAWVNAHAYVVGNKAFDAANGTFWDVAVNHTSAATGSFAADRAGAATGKWTANATTIARKPVISAFEYASGGNVRRMYAAQATKLFDVTAATPVLVKSGQASGNWCAAQFENAQADWMLAVNEAGDFPLRFNGATWVTLDPALGAPADGASAITGGPTAVPGKGLTYVWKYRNRLFFIEGASMNAYYLPLNAVGGALGLIPLAGAFSKGGSLLFGANWSIDAGDGIDDKCCFVTDQGEIAIFTGSNPADAAAWRQEGRYALSPPLGMNAHILVGGDLLILTVDGIVPVSQAITKDAGQLELALITRNIKRMWREEVNAKRAWPWTAKKWDEYGALFVTFPGGAPGARYCVAANNVSGAWSRFKGYDATCFIRMREDCFFGNQDGIVMQADRTGYDDGVPYVATLVGGWETFGAPASEIVWHQARASFTSEAGQPFQPQLAATIDYEVIVPPPPPAGPDPGVLDVWDQGLWDVAKWDQPTAATVGPVRNTLWCSIGQTGFAHAPIVQVTVAQRAKPNVELIVIAATYERAGVNV